MKNLLLLLALILLGCSSQRKLTNDFYEEDQSINLFAFVGKKISVIEFDPNAERVEKIEIDSVTGEKFIRKSFIADKAFRCKYLVVKNVFNRLQNDTVDFVAYDHYGRPGFEDSEFVMLYISKSSKGNYYFHQKYQFDYLERDSSRFLGHIFDLKDNVWIAQKKEASLKDLFEYKKENVFSKMFEVDRK